MFVPVSVYMHMNTVSREARRGIRSLQAGVTGPCELPDLVLGSSARAVIIPSYDNIILEGKKHFLKPSSKRKIHSFLLQKSYLELIQI